MRSLLLTISVLAFWYLVVAATPAIHRMIFALVPPDGSIRAEERIAADAKITAYTRYFPPSRGNLPQLSAKELSHLDDVLALNGTIWLAVLPGALIGLFLSRFRLTEPLAATWAIGLIGLIGLVSLAMFEPIFTGIHPLLFPNGGWELLADQFLLTRVYPLPFFAISWALILLFSIGTLFILRIITGVVRST